MPYLSIVKQYTERLISQILFSDLYHKPFLICFWQWLEQQRSHSGLQFPVLKDNFPAWKYFVSEFQQYIAGSNRVCSLTVINLLGILDQTCTWYKSTQFRQKNPKDYDKYNPWYRLCLSRNIWRKWNWYFHCLVIFSSYTNLLSICYR